MATSTLEKEKERRISEELRRLEELFAGADHNHRAAAAPLMQNAAFMKITLDDLQLEINTNGATEEYQNGNNQRGMKASAALQGYNSLIKNYNSTMRALISILPDAPSRSLADIMAELMNDE